MAAAALMHAIVHDHPFHNANKRTALVALRRTRTSFLR
jgi:prophage maintenance system killer protein